MLPSLVRLWPPTAVPPSGAGQACCFVCLAISFGRAASEALAGRPSQSPGCVALQGRPNPGLVIPIPKVALQGRPLELTRVEAHRATALRTL